MTAGRRAAMESDSGRSPKILSSLTGRKVFPAGWPLRRFTPDELASLLSLCAPRVIEISKDCLRERSSLKDLARSLSRVRSSVPADLVFAGTTDLVACSGFSWESYRRYLGVQVAQARFLECTMFRFLMGGAVPSVPSAEVVRRVLDFCRDLAPIQPCVEIHASLESEPEMLAELLRLTPVQIVVDLENMLRARFTLDELLRIVPRERVAFFHHRNLEGTWVEHPPSVVEEQRSRELFPEGIFLWEPKTIDDPERIRELCLEHLSLN